MATNGENAEHEDWWYDWHTMEESCRRIASYTNDRSYEHFLHDERTYDAVVRNLHIISHAGRGLPHEVRQRIGASEWRAVAGFERAVSDSVTRDNRAVVWTLARNDVPDLLEHLETVDLDRARVAGDPGERMRGRLARHPGQIPWRGWRDISLRVWAQMFAHNIFIVAGGIAFYGLLSIFPALAMLVSIYGLLFDVADVQAQLETLAALIPSEAWGVIESQLTRIVQNPRSTLSISVLVTFLIALWSAGAGVGGLMLAMNIVYQETEKRSLVVWYAWRLLLTIGALVFSVLALALIVALPALLSRIGLTEQTQMWVSLLRWPVLAVSTTIALAILYRYGPSRRPAKWRWVTGGAVAATLLWLLGSVLFSSYIANFGNYNETYGSVGAVVVLMLWFFVSAFIVLLGAEFDAETEHQSRIDSTVGRPRPMGERGAYVADTLGRRP